MQMFFITHPVSYASSFTTPVLYTFVLFNSGERYAYRVDNGEGRRIGLDLDAKKKKNQTRKKL